MKELNTFRKFIQENELHEGTWGYGSKDSMIKTLAQLDKIRQMGGVKGSLELDKLDDMLYRVFGDDTFHDAIDRAKADATDDDRFANAIGDAQARGIEMLKFHDRVDEEELKENDAVLDEVIEETVFDDIDNNLKLMAVHMTAQETLEDLVAEFSIIPGGTKILAQALRNIVADNKLTGDFQESINDKTLNEIINEGIFADLKDAIQTGLAKQLFRLVPDKPEIVDLYLQQAKEEGLEEEFIVEYLEFMSSIDFRPNIATKAKEYLSKIK